MLYFHSGEHFNKPPVPADSPAAIHFEPYLLIPIEEAKALGIAGNAAKTVAKNSQAYPLFDELASARNDIGTTLVKAQEYATANGTRKFFGITATSGGAGLNFRTFIPVDYVRDSILIHGGLRDTTYSAARKLHLNDRQLTGWHIQIIKSLNGHPRTAKEIMSDHRRKLPAIAHQFPRRKTTPATALFQYDGHDGYLPPSIVFKPLRK